MSKTDQSEVNTLGFASTTMELQKNFKQVEEIMANFAKSYDHMDLDPFNLMKSSAEWYAALAKDPQKAINANLSFMQKSMELYQQSLTNLLGGSVVSDPVIEEDRSDRRFKHEGWADQPAFNSIKQSYLLASKWMRDQVQGVEGLDEHTAEKVEFFTERYLDAMSPTNFAATNPAVIEKIVETKGANLVHGLKNMLEDLEAGKGELRIRMTDTSAFELGENVATTPGKVVFQNRMFQLIQYTPSTDKALKRPLLVVPPWINKYYIMDLQPKNSLLKWLVDQGHTVFVVSWVNPDASYADTEFANYVTEGVLEAVDAVERATGESEINMIGYCIGGSLLATSLAYMKAKGDTRVKSATFFTTMLDFSDPGELGVFIDEEQISGLEKKMGESGYLDGSQMAGTFNLMRANDLIWSFYINNYLLGNDPRPFDLLYWNSDSTACLPRCTPGICVISILRTTCVNQAVSPLMVYLSTSLRSTYRSALSQPSKITSHLGNRPTPELNCSRVMFALSSVVLAILPVSSTHLQRANTVTALPMSCQLILKSGLQKPPSMKVPGGLNGIVG